MLCFHDKMCRDFILKSSLIMDILSILVLSGLFWWAGIMEQSGHCLCALKQIMEVA